MSSDSPDPRAQMLAALAQELRQFHILGASVFRAAAARIGMTVTDLQVIDLLQSAGPMTAGQLAELTGLTTGAITGMLTRLEEAGLLRRERDPSDGRRVIVQLERGTDTQRDIDALLASLGTASEDLASSSSDEQLAFLREFLGRSNARSREELARLRGAAPEEEGGIYSAPLGDLVSAQLVIPAGVSQLTLRADRDIGLYQARFLGSVPEVKTRDGVITIRYPRRLWGLGSGLGTAEVTLNAAIPWGIKIHGGASEITAELGSLNLAGLEVKGGASTIRLELPVPASVVPIRISGGASMVTLQRPTGVPARVHLKGWASTLVFDEQTWNNAGNDVRLQSPGYDGTAPGYDIDVASSASTVTVTSG